MVLFVCWSLSEINKNREKKTWYTTKKQNENKRSNAWLSFGIENNSAAAAANTYNNQIAYYKTENLIKKYSQLKWINTKVSIRIVRVSGCFVLLFFFAVVVSFSLLFVPSMCIVIKHLIYQCLKVFTSSIGTSLRFFII